MITINKENFIPDLPDTPVDRESYDTGDGDIAKEDSDVESMDEESLKDAEVDLTDDQKEERRLIAEGLKVSGNQAFKDGHYEQSIEKYTEGKFYYNSVVRR